MLVSIIIPVYNAERFLTKCLDSIQNQTYTNLEIILVNDGSTDQSGIICDEYSQKDTRFIVIHKENGGVSSARNAGLKIAKGKYIGFIDPDDWIDLCMFEKLYQLIIEYKADISTCGYFEENVSGSTIFTNTLSGIVKYNRADALNTILNINGFRGFVCNKLFSADLIKKAPAVFFDTDIYYGEDLLFCCEVVSRCSTIIYDPTRYYHYIIHDSNTTLPNYSPKKLTFLNALDKMIHLLSDVKGVDLNQYKNLYMHTNISLLMYGIQEKKCTGLIRKHLKQNLYRYNLSNFYGASVKFSYSMARVNIYLCYFIWRFYKALEQLMGSISPPLSF